ncbi:hypothetical protein BZG36_02075 [Bifiguratus adelaidae]|uniref:Importin N-terminal domain-containing protein n=1 Tax=Bifiguratus adelaidae TaxID=1938954 RepID=A0A261Y351_9FUNG|nr:hypothetical protein BZG36_02075 [Bifiguratus adelaidae]
MQQEVVSNVLNALDVIYNPVSSDQDRQAAQEYCESLKKDPRCPIYGHDLALAKHGYNDIVRHFGLGLLEEAVRFHWGDGLYGDQEREIMKGYVSDLLANGTKEMSVEKRFVKEKVARLFVEVVKREWPVRWPDMDRHLQQLYETNPGVRELILMVYRGLAEDIFIYEDMVAAVRKKELQRALFCVLVSDNVLQIQYPEGVKLDSENDFVNMRGEQGNPGWMQRWTASLRHSLESTGADPNSEALSVALLRTLSAHMDWIIPKAIVEANLLPVICNALLVESLSVRTAAVECLLILFNRNFTSYDDRAALIWPVLDHGGLDVIFAAFQKAKNDLNAADEEGYQFVQKLAQSIVTLGVSQICFKRNISLVPQQFAKYLDLLFVVGSHPSYHVSSATIEFWQSGLRHEFVHIYQYRESDNSPAMEYLDLDFSGIADDMKTFVGNCRQRIIELLRLIAKTRPFDSFYYLSPQIEKSMASLVLELKASGSSERLLRILDVQIGVSEALLLGIGSSLGQDSKATEQDLFNVDSFIIRMLSDDSSDMNLRKSLLNIVSSSADIIRVYPRSTFSILEKVFNILTATFSSPEDGDSATSVRSETRLKAMQTLVKLAMKIPNQLMPTYNEIAAAVGNIMNQFALKGPERTVLLEFMLTIGLGSDTDEIKQREIFSSIVEPLVAAWASEHISNYLASQSAFQQVIGISFLMLAGQRRDSQGIADPDLTKQESEELNQSRQKRQELLRCESALHTMYKRMIDIGMADTRIATFWQPYLASILPNTLMFTRALHCLWSTPVRQQFPQPLEAVLHISDSERAFIIGKYFSYNDIMPFAKRMLGKGQKSKVSRLQTRNYTDEINSLRSYLASAREESYQLVGNLSRLGTTYYSIPGLLDNLQASLFCEAEVIENRHWKLLISLVVRPLVLNCPGEYLQSFLPQFFPEFLGFLNRKLATDWDTLIAAGLKMSSSEEEQDNFPHGADENVDVDDIVTEKILRDASRALVEFMVQIFAPGEASQEKNKVLQAFLLDDANIATSVCTTLTQLITVKDSSTCQRAINVALKLMQPIAQRPLLYDFMAQRVLTAALEALHDSYHEEDQDRLLLLITEIYIAFRPLIDTPLHLFAKLPNMSPSKLETFENSFSTSKEKQQRALTKQLLQDIIGVSKGQWYRKQQSYIPDTSVKAAIKRHEDPNKEEEGEGLPDLFDD